MVWGIIAAVISVVASAGVYYQQKKMEAQAAKQAQEAKAVQVSGHDSNRGLYTVYGQTLVGSTIVWKQVSDKEARITQSGFTTISAATGSELTTNKDHKNNRWLYRAVTLCNGPVTDITNVTIDDEGYRSPRFTNKTNKHFATTYSLGPTAGQNFSALRTAYSSDFYGWASDATGKGVAYAMERLYLDKDKPAYQGEPQTRYRIKGRALYDPRKDSTSSAYNSNLGTSSHRADTATTWEYSDNPVLALLDYMRSGEYGRGLDLSVIDIDSIATSADKCDVLVDIPQRLANDTGSVVTYYDPETGETYIVTVNGDYPYYRADQQTTGTNANKQRRFRINMAVDPSKEILDNIQEILNVFRGNLSYANGTYFVHMADVASPVLTLNDDDIIGGLKIANGDRSQRMNRATVKFINQAKQYKTDQVSWPSLDSNEDGGLYATYLAQDEDEKLHRTFTIKGCTDFYQAQDTAEFLVRDSRSNLSVSGTFGSRCFGLIPGDVVALDYDSSGFSGKYFRVIQTQVDLVSMNVGLQLKEYDSSVYTWNTSRGNEPLGLSWQEEVVNADPTNLTIGTIATNTRTRADGSTALTLTVPFSDVPEAAQYVEISWAINNTNDYNTQLVFDTESQTQTEVAIERDGETYAIRARYFATNSYGTLIPSAYTETTHAVASLSGTKLDGIETGATQNTGDLADLDTVDTDQIENEAVSILKIANTLETTNFSTTNGTGWQIKTDGTATFNDVNVRGEVVATQLNVQDATISGSLRANELSDGIVKITSVSQEVWNEIESRVGSTTGSTGFFESASGNLTGGDLTLTTASTKAHASGQTVYFEFDAVYFWSSATSVSGDDLLLDVKFQHSTDNVTYTTANTTQITIERHNYFNGFMYDIDESVQYQLTGLAAGNYYFRVSLEPVGATPNAFSIAYLGVPVTFEVNEIGTGTVATGGNADLLDNIDSTGFLRLGSSGSTIDNTAYGNQTFTGDVTVTGSLILQGSIDQYSVTDLNVTDKTITVNSGNTQSLSDGAGLIVDRGTAADASILWDETDDQFDFSHDVTAPNLTIGNWDAAYTYSQVGHLPLSGGALTGNLTIPVSNKLYFGGNNHTYITEDTDDRLRFFTGGAEFMRFTESTADTINFYQKIAQTPPANTNESWKLTVSDNIANQIFTAMLLDYNISGSDAIVGADRAHKGFVIDVDSSATGGTTSDEHRVYGQQINVRCTGDSDIIYGLHNVAEAQQTAGTVSHLYGVYSEARGDVTSGTLSNQYAVYGYSSLGSATGSIISNAYGGFFKVISLGAQDSNVNKMTGVYAEVEVDASSASTAVSTAMCVEAQFDNDSAGDVTITNGYLFYGNYAGTLPTTAWGVYIADTVPNRFNGSIETGLGSTTTASYGFNGDINTGMYSPANHEVAFLANGQQKLKVSGTGIDVTGTGTFTTADNSAQVTLISTDTDALAGPQLNLWRNSGTGTNGDLIGQITFTGEDTVGSTNTFATIYGVADQTNNGAEDGSIHFQTLINGVLADRFEINSAGNSVFTGNVGINNSSPNAPLEVSGAATTSTDIAHFSNSNGVQKAVIGIDGQGDGQITLIDAANNTDVLFTAGGVSYINTGGNFGVGTSSPQALTHIYTESGINTADTLLKLTNVANTARYVGFQAQRDNASGQGLNVLITKTDASVVNALTIDTSSNVGIGDSNPAEKLTVAGNILLNASNAQINIKSGVGTTSGAVNWTFNTTGTDYASIKLPYATRATTGLHIDSGYPITIDCSTRINFAVSGNTRFRITNTAFEVGTTPIIDLNRNLTNIGTISSQAISSVGNATISNPSAGASITLRRTDVNTSGIFLVGSSFSYIGTTSNKPFHLYQNNASALQIDTSKNATFAGNISSGDITSTGTGTFGTQVALAKQGTATSSSAQFSSASVVFEASGWDVNNAFARTGRWTIKNVPTASNFPDFDLNFYEEGNGLKFQLHGRGSNTYVDPLAASFYGDVNINAYSASSSDGGDGNLTVAGTGAFSDKLTISNGNYANHLELVRGSDTLYLTPSGGQLLTNGGLSPAVTNQYALGRTDKYWQDLWLGTSLKMGGTTVINASRNLINIGTISSGAITSSGTITTSGSFVGVNAIVDNVIAKTSGGNILFKTNGGSSIARFNNNQSADFFGAINSSGLIKGTRSITSADVDYLRLQMSSWSQHAGYLKSLVWHDGANNIAGIGAEYDQSKTNIHFHSQYNAGYKGTSVKTFSVFGNGNVDVLGTTLSVGNSTGGNQFFKRPSANYIFADQTGGYLVFGTNGLSTSLSNASLTLDASKNATFGGTINSGAITSSGIVDAPYFIGGSGAYRVKFSVWTGTTYGIGMKTGFTYGGLGNQYAMCFQMNSTATRGWWWGNNIQTDAQGAMALTTEGKMTVSHSMRLGYGANDTTTPGATHALDVSGSIYASSDIYADGGNLIIGDDAFSNDGNYVGLKTSAMTGAYDYMIISAPNDGNTYISAKNGNSVYIRGGGNLASNEIRVPDSTFIQVDTNNFNVEGNITAFHSSDESLKENIRVIDSPIEKIKQIRGVYFDWTDDYIKQQSGDGQIDIRKSDIGVIAQDVQPVLDEVVTTRKDGTMAVRYEKMIALCIEAIKDQQDQIDLLKDIIEDMKNGNN